MESRKSYNQYRRLLLMAGLSFICMYVLMYAMVDSFTNVYANFNQFYMAGLMTAPMVLIELSLMGTMYHHRKINTLLILGSVAALAGLWILVRQQVGIADTQFLKSMIPHHGGAILMCKNASLRDPDLLELCDGIISNQQSEIDLMKAKLKGIDESRRAE